MSGALGSTSSSSGGDASNLTAPDLNKADMTKAFKENMTAVRQCEEPLAAGSVTPLLSAVGLKHQYTEMKTESGNLYVEEKGQGYGKDHGDSIIKRSELKNKDNSTCGEWKPAQGTVGNVKEVVGDSTYAPADNCYTDRNKISDSKLLQENKDKK